MAKVLAQLEKLGPDSSLELRKVELLTSYTKHYNKFKDDFELLTKFPVDQLEKEFEKSKNMDGRTGKWKENLKYWEMENHIPTPNTVRKDYNMPPN